FRSVISGLLVTLTVAASAAETGAAGSMSDAEINRGFQSRRDAVLDAATAMLNPADLTKGSYMEVAAALQRGERRDTALARFAKLNEPTPTANMFWTYPMATVMAAGRAGLDESSW